MANAKSTLFLKSLLCFRFFNKVTLQMPCSDALWMPGELLLEVSAFARYNQPGSCSLGDPSCQ